MSTSFTSPRYLLSSQLVRSSILLTSVDSSKRHNALLLLLSTPLRFRLLLHQNVSSSAVLSSSRSDSPEFVLPLDEFLAPAEDDRLGTLCPDSVVVKSFHEELFSPQQHRRSRDCHPLVLVTYSCLESRGEGRCRLHASYRICHIEETGLSCVVGPGKLPCCRCVDISVSKRTNCSVRLFCCLGSIETEESKEDEEEEEEEEGEREEGKSQALSPSPSPSPHSVMCCRLYCPVLCFVGIRKMKEIVRLEVKLERLIDVCHAGAVEFSSLGDNDECCLNQRSRDCVAVAKSTCVFFVWVRVVHGKRAGEIEKMEWDYGRVIDLCCFVDVSPWSEDQQRKERYLMVARSAKSTGLGMVILKNVLCVVRSVTEMVSVRLGNSEVPVCDLRVWQSKQQEEGGVCFWFVLQQDGDVSVVRDDQQQPATGPGLDVVAGRKFLVGDGRSSSLPRACGLEVNSIDVHRCVVRVVFEYGDCVRAVFGISRRRVGRRVYRFESEGRDLNSAAVLRRPSLAVEEYRGLSLLVPSEDVGAVSRVQIGVQCSLSALELSFPESVGRISRVFSLCVHPVPARGVFLLSSSSTQTSHIFRSPHVLRSFEFFCSFFLGRFRNRGFAFVTSSSREIHARILDASTWSVTDSRLLHSSSRKRRSEVGAVSVSAADMHTLGDGQSAIGLCLISSSSAQVFLLQGTDLGSAVRSGATIPNLRTVLGCTIVESRGNRVGICLALPSRLVFLAEESGKLRKSCVFASDEGVLCARRISPSSVVMFSRNGRVTLLTIDLENSRVRPSSSLTLESSRIDSIVCDASLRHGLVFLHACDGSLTQGTCLSVVRGNEMRARRLLLRKGQGQGFGDVEFGCSFDENSILLQSESGSLSRLVLSENCDHIALSDAVPPPPPPASEKDEYRRFCDITAPSFFLYLLGSRAFEWDRHSGSLSVVFQTKNSEERLFSAKYLPRGDLVLLISRVCESRASGLYLVKRMSSLTEPYVWEFQCGVLFDDASTLFPVCILSESLVVVEIDNVLVPVRVQVESIDEEEVFSLTRLPGHEIRTRSSALSIITYLQVLRSHRHGSLLLVSTLLDGIFLVVFDENSRLVTVGGGQVSESAGDCCCCAALTSSAGAGGDRILVGTTSGVLVLFKLDPVEQGGREEVLREAVLPSLTTNTDLDLMLGPRRFQGEISHRVVRRFVLRMMGRVELGTIARSVSFQNDQGGSEVVVVSRDGAVLTVGFD